jgi:hypothetical protein
MASSVSTRRAAIVTIQTAIGLLFFVAWALLQLMLFDMEVIQVIAGGLPYFVVYELGVLSRYLPGIKSMAKRLE